MGTPRLLTDIESVRYPVAGGIVTADDASDRQEYNCHGFAVGIRAVLTTDDGPQFMRSMAYALRRPADIRPDDDVVALFFKAGCLEPWHAAKRLRGRGLPADLYESKCGFEIAPERMSPVFRPKQGAPREGLRIAHVLEAIRPIYGEIDSFWVRDNSSEGCAKRARTLNVDYFISDAVLVADSGATLEQAWPMLEKLLQPE